MIAYYVLAHGRVSLQLSPLLAVAGAYGFWLLLSAYWADSSADVYSTFFGYLLVIAYMLAFAVLVKTPRQVLAVFVVIVVGATLSGFVALNTYLVTGGSLRASGLEGAAHPDTFGVYQAMIAPVALGLFALARTARMRLAYLACMAVIALSIVSSLTRTAMISVAVVAAARPRAAVARPVPVGRPEGDVCRRAGGDGRGRAHDRRVGDLLRARGLDLQRRGQEIAPPGARTSGPPPGTPTTITRGSGSAPATSSSTRSICSRRRRESTSAPPYVAQGRLVHNAYLEALTELGPVGLALFIARDRHDGLVSRARVPARPRLGRRRLENRRGDAAARAAQPRDLDGLPLDRAEQAAVDHRRPHARARSDVGEQGRRGESRAAGAAPASRAGSRAGVRPLVLCYHAVSETWHHELSVPPDVMERQLRLLLDRGYRPATAAEAVTGAESFCTSPSTTRSRASGTLCRFWSGTVSAQRSSRAPVYAEDGRALDVPELDGELERGPRN